MEELMVRMSDKKFEVRKLGLAKSALGIHKSEDLSRTFCSELIIDCYKELGLLPNDLNSSNYLPKDFTVSEEKAKFHLRHPWDHKLFPLMKGTYLEEGVEVISDFVDFVAFKKDPI